MLAFLFMKIEATEKTNEEYKKDSGDIIVVYMEGKKRSEYQTSVLLTNLNQ